MSDVSTQPADPVAAMLDKQAVADAIGCSTRHIDRMVESGRIPLPVQLGRLVRWPQAVIDRWIAAGCPPVAAELRPGGGDE